MGYLRPPTFVTCTFALAVTASGVASAQVPPSYPAPLPDPRGGPRLEYQRGPAACLPEQEFRHEVAIAVDGGDHLHATAPDVLSVRFETDPKGYRVTVEHTNSGGIKDPITIKIHSNCELLARNVAFFIAHNHIPYDPPPAPTPALTCDPCASAADDKEKLAELRRKLDGQETRINEQGARLDELSARLTALQRALDEAKKKQMDLTGVLSAGAFITANLTSNVGPGLWVGGEARSGPLSLGLELSVVLPAPVLVAEVPKEGKLDFDLSQVVGKLTPCGRYLYFFGCVVAGAGVQIRHDSNVTPTPYTQTGALVQFGGRVGIEVPFGESAFGARAWGEVLYSSPQARQSYDGDEGHFEWYRPDVSAFFGIGMIVKLGGKEVR